MARNRSVSRRLGRGQAVFFSAWFISGLLLFALWLTAWAESAGMKEFFAGIEGLYGYAPGMAPPLLAPDHHLHVLVAFACCSWLAITIRLLRPTIPAWIPYALFIAIAVGDETCQAFSPNRAFEWDDLLSDLIGLTVSLPLTNAVRARLSDRRGSGAGHPAPSAGRRQRQGR